MNTTLPFNQTATALPCLTAPTLQRSTVSRGPHFNASTLQRFNVLFPPCNLVTLVTLATTLLLTGCTSPRPLKGGQARTTPKPTGGLEQTLVQSENPAQATKQDQQTVRVRSYTVPAGSRLEQLRLSEVAPGLALTNVEAVVVSAPMPVTEWEETRANTELGPAQKDTAREIGAKLSSLKSLVWVGLGLFVFGLGSLFYPPLRVIINSVTTSLALVLGGLALMVLPTLVVGHELLLLAGVSGLLAAWFLAHRHGQLRGSLESQLSLVPSSAAPADGERTE